MRTDVKTEKQPEGKIRKEMHCRTERWAVKQRRTITAPTTMILLPLRPHVEG